MYLHPQVYDILSPYGLTVVAFLSYFQSVTCDQCDYYEDAVKT